MRVSVIMPSYRHGAYIAQAIESVLTQTIDDIELVIIDDASPDASNDIIRGFHDPRIVHIPLPANVGASEAMNIGLRKASGPLIAVCNSDDVWERTKLRRQLDILDHAPDIAAVFSDVSWIGPTGRTIDNDSSRPLGNFSQENRPRHAWLKRLVEGGNCLCHPSILARRTIYETCGHYDRYLRQLPDYDMWLRILQRHDIYVMPDRLVRFRMHDGNTSRSSAEACRRDTRECLFILRKFFDQITAVNFTQTFACDDMRPAAGMDDSPADPCAVLSYLSAYQGPLKNIFQDIMLERIYRAPAEIREATLSAHAFQVAMAEPYPAFMSQRASPPARAPKRFLKKLQRTLTALWRNKASKT